MSEETEEMRERDERLPLEFATQQKRLVCIEFPGYINDISTALTTIGGEEQINATLKDPLRRLGLHLRPKDPYCCQGYGDRYPVTDLLMKVKRKTRKRNGEEEVKYECEILGVIDTVVKFKGLMDFQYLVPNIPDLLGSLRGSDILDIPTPLHIPPPSFCRLDHPFDYQYKSDAVSKTKPRQANEQSLGATLRKPRPSFVITCNFHVPVVPTQPKDGAVEVLRRFNNEGLDVVERLFKIRPIWSRRAVIYHMGDKANRIKYVLPCVAYYWIAGPWRTFWSKFGYDPRKNSAAKIYQKLDFRLRSKKELRNMKLLPPTVRGSTDFLFATRLQTHVKKSVIPIGVDSAYASHNPGTSCQDDEAEPEILPYAFYPDRPPITRQIIYQLCDLRCSEIQKLISANDGLERECSESDGWLEAGTLETIRKLMTKYMTELSEKMKREKHFEVAAGEEEPTGDIEDEVATFLDTLMDDEDVEAYDLLGDEDV